MNRNEYKWIELNGSEWIEIDWNGWNLLEIEKRIVMNRNEGIEMNRTG